MDGPTRGRWLSNGVGVEEGARVFDELAVSLIDGLHHPRFLIVGDPVEAEALHVRWADPTVAPPN